MQYLSDELLLKSYQQALQLKLSEDFIQLLLNEIRKRKLTVLFNLSEMQKGSGPQENPLHSGG